MPGPEFEAGAALDVAEEAGAVTKICENGGGCLAAGTPIWMADGSVKLVEQVQAGDWVLSRNPVNGVTEASQVSTTTMRLAGFAVAVTLTDQQTGAAETITASPEHPFYTPNGFVPAERLQEGFNVVTRAGALLTVTHVAKETQEGGVPVYNFVVPGDHTYFAGTIGGGAWVHNPRLCGADLRRYQRMAADVRAGRDVEVGSIDEADLLLNVALPNARKYKGTSAKKPDFGDFKEVDPNGSYHKDYNIDPETGRIYGHNEQNRHGTYKHINIKLSNGRKVTIKITPRTPFR